MKENESESRMPNNALVSVQHLHVSSYHIPAPSNDPIAQTQKKILGKIPPTHSYAWKEQREMMVIRECVGIVQ